MFVRGRECRLGSSVSPRVILAMCNPCERELRKCGSITAGLPGIFQKNRARNSGSAGLRRQTHTVHRYQDRCAPLTLPLGESKMRKTKTTRYDVAEHLRTPEEMAAYLEACLDEAKGDAAFIAKALGDIARARGMTQVARDTGLSRESLYEALSVDRSPDFDTIHKVVSALGIRLHAEVAER